MKTKLFFVSVLAAFPAMSMAHFDVRPYAVSGKIVTDGYEDATSTLLSNVRVFGYDFGEDATDPFNIQDPGFNAIAGSGLTPSADLRFNVLDSLKYWDGLGSVVLSNAPASESLHLFLGAGTVTANGSSGAQTGFKIQTVNANGSVHKHLNAELLGSDNNSIPAGPGAWGAGDGIEATAGIYFLPIELTMSSGGLINSDSMYLVFNNGLTEETHDQAISFAETNLVPEPSSLAIMGLGLCAMLRRRRA